MRNIIKNKQNLSKLLLILKSNNIKYSIVNDKIYLKNNFLTLNLKKIKGVLDLSSIENLKILWCYDNQITKIICNDKLQGLWCSDNKITEIICNDNLQELICFNNQISKLDIPKSLTHLSCKDNNLPKYYYDNQRDLDKLREIILADKRIKLIKELLKE